MLVISILAQANQLESIIYYYPYTLLPLLPLYTIASYTLVPISYPFPIRSDFRAMKYKARNERCKKGGKEIWASAQKVEQKENRQSALLPGLRKHCQGTERSPSSNMIHPEDRYTSQGRYELTKTLRANLFHSGFAWTYVNIEDGEPFCFCGKHNLLNGQMYSCQRYEVVRSWTKRETGNLSSHVLC